MTETFLMGIQVVAVLIFLISVGSFRHPRVRPVSFLVSGAALLVLSMSGAALVTAQPWLVTICAGIAGIVAAGALVWRATLVNMALVHLTLVGVMASAASICGALLLFTSTPSALGAGITFKVLMALSTTTSAGLAAAAITASLFAARVVPGPITVPFRAWWLPASVLMCAGVLAVALSGASIWSLLVAVLCGVGAGVAVTVASPVSIPRVIPAFIAAIGVVVMLQGAAMSSFVVVTVAGVCVGVGAAAYRVMSANAATAQSVTHHDLTPITPSDAAVLLNTARQVVVVPGYDVAVHSSEHLLADIVTALDRAGTHVVVAAHPAAGRLPGHMTTLMLDAGLDVDHVVSDPFEADRYLQDSDVTLLVGAPDVALRDEHDVRSATQGFAVGRSRRVVAIPGDATAWGIEQFQDSIARRTAVMDGELPETLVALKKSLVSY